MRIIRLFSVRLFRHSKRRKRLILCKVSSRWLTNLAEDILLSLRQKERTIMRSLRMSIGVW
jgi:hypothetical protein